MSDLAQEFLHPTLKAMAYGACGCVALYAANVYAGESIIVIFTFASLKVLGFAIAAYLFYWRVYDYTLAVNFYKSQGDEVAFIEPNYYPGIGSFPFMFWSAYRSYVQNDNYHVLKNGIDKCYEGKPNSGPTLVAFVSTGAALPTRNVKVIEAMYTTKNKYFDKHPLIKDLSFCLTGESILFAETTDDWRKSRKSMSPAFYKGKLEDLCETAKSAVRTTMTRFKAITTKGPRQELDIIEEIGLMTARILLVCALGTDCAEDPV